MKLRNRIMSWILSPGAYAVWHALGATEEWECDGAYRLTHKATNVTLSVDVDDGGSIFVHAFCFDGTRDTPEFMGYFERHIVWQRAYRVCQRIRGQTTRRQRNREVFARMCLPINKEVS